MQLYCDEGTLWSVSACLANLAFLFFFKLLSRNSYSYSLWSYLRVYWGSYCVEVIVKTI